MSDYNSDYDRIIIVIGWTIANKLWYNKSTGLIRQILE